MKLLAFICNSPWTLLGIICAFISFPYTIEFSKQPTAILLWVRSFWWYTWLPGKKGLRAMALGNCVLLGKIIDQRDIHHELIHVEQYQRKPFIQFFLYNRELLQKGYRNNKYEEEAYRKAGNKYISE